MATSQCKNCLGPIAYEPSPDYPNLKPNICKVCGESILAAEAGQATAKRLEDYLRLCPAIYHDTNPKHPGMPNALPRILAWKYGPKGMVIHGDSRRGKTRSAWLLLKRLIVEDGRKVRALSSTDFARQCAKAYGMGAEVAAEWFEDLAKAEVLFIDDFGKSKLTERVESELFDLIDNRTSWGRPIILTTNFVGKALAEKMTPDRGIPTVERIREFCEDIAL